MDENVATRVTRSLRKRINSTESEPTPSRAGTPSRGGTPLRNLNLEAIAEDTPSKARGRRRSVNVDAVETPSKALARLSAVTESPAASPRRTRRASFSQEDLKPTTPAKGRRLSAVSSLQKVPVAESPKRGRPKVIKDDIIEAASVASPKRAPGRPKSIKEDTVVSSPKSVRGTRSKTKSPSGSPKSVRSQTKSPSLIRVAERSSSRSPSIKSIPESDRVLRSTSKSPNILNISKEKETEIDSDKTNDLKLNPRRIDLSKENIDNVSADDKKSKSIQFIADDDNDERERTKYLKTPHISKNRSTMGCENSGDNSFELLEINNKSKKDVSEKSSESMKSEDIPDEIAMKTPHRNKLISMSSSTPIGVSTAISTSKLELSLKEVSEENIQVDKDVSVVPEEKGIEENPKTSEEQEMEVDLDENVLKEPSAKTVEEVPKTEVGVTSHNDQEIVPDEVKTNKNGHLNVEEDMKSSQFIQDERNQVSVPQIEKHPVKESIEKSSVEPNETDTGSGIEESKVKDSILEVESVPKVQENVVETVSHEALQSTELVSAGEVRQIDESMKEIDGNVESQINQEDKTLENEAEKPNEEKKVEQVKHIDVYSESPTKMLSKTPEKACNEQKDNEKNEANNEPLKKTPMKSPRKMAGDQKDKELKDETNEKLGSPQKSVKTPQTMREEASKLSKVEESKGTDGSSKEKHSPMEGKTPSEEPKMPEEVQEDFSSSWNASVRRPATSKIDKHIDKPKEEVIKDHRKPKLPFIVDGNSDDDDEKDIPSSDNEEKNPFLDDEAEEAEEEEDSMDEEEREYLRQNEIPEQGHSIGSEDSEEEIGEEEDDDSFIVADSEVEEEEANAAIQMVSDEDDLTDGAQPKKYKRIQKLESSDDEGDAKPVETKTIDEKPPRKSMGRKSFAAVQPMDVDECEDEEKSDKPDFGAEETFMRKEDKEALMINVTKFIDQDSESENAVTTKTSVEEDEEKDSEEDVISVSDSGSDNDVDIKQKSGGSPMRLRVSDSESGKDVKKITSKDNSMTKKTPLKLRVSDSESEVNKHLDESNTNTLEISASKKNKRLSGKAVVKEASDEKEENLNTSQKKSLNSSRKSKRLSSNKAAIQESSDDEENSSQKPKRSPRSRKSEDRKEANKELNSSKLFLESLNSSKVATNSKSNEEVEDEESSDSDKEEIEKLKKEGLLKTKRYNKNNETLEDGELSDQENISNVSNSKKRISEKLPTTYQDEVLAEKPLPKRFAQQVLHNSLNQSYGKYGGDSEELCTSEDDQDLYADETHKKLSVSMSENLLNKQKKTKSSFNHSHIGITLDVCDEQLVENIPTKKKEKLVATSTSFEKQEENVQFKKNENVNPKANRKSMSAVGRQDSKKIRRRSLSSERELSSSFAEHISKKKKKENTHDVNEDIENQTPEQSPQKPETSSKKKARPSSSKKSEKPKKTFKDEDILNACDLYLEAANLAKREAIIQNKKTLKDKILQKKLEKKKKFHEEKEKEDQRRVLENAIKKKKAKAIRKAAIAAKNLLDREVVVNVKKPTKMLTESDSRRLPEQVLSALSGNSQEQRTPPKQKSKKFKTKSSSEEDSPIQHKKVKKQKGAKLIKTAGGVFLEEPLTPPKPKRKVLEIMKTKSGIVRVESLTPEKGSPPIDVSFREEDKTPKAIGFKIRQILSAGQRGGIPKLEVTKKASKKKRALAETETSNLLPKPKWSKFEDETEASSLPKIVAKTSSTQFSVAKVNNNTLGVNMNALNFKTNALFNNDKIKRESSKEILARKRKL